MAAARGHLTVVQELLANNAEVDAVTTLGRTPLHQAALGGHIFVVQALKSQGADSTLQNTSGNMPISLANPSNLDIKHLLGGPGVVDSKDLLEPAKRGDVNAVLNLVARGAQVTVTDAAGNSPSSSLPRAATFASLSCCSSTAPIRALRCVMPPRRCTSLRRQARLTWSGC